MNILILHSWLKEYLDTNTNAQKISEYLSLCSASVEELKKIGSDYAYYLEISSNRVDLMSVLGIARELAVILPQFGIKAKLKVDPYSQIPNSKQQAPNKLEKDKLKIIIKDQELCPRFTAVVMDQVVIKPSPKTVQEKLTKSGLRPINNIVDITNLLARELGQPFHAFDYDKIAKKTMLIRASKKGEKIITLDGQTNTLPGDDIVIEDGEKKLIDLCGIMGGQNSEITNQTKKVLLFVQNYDPLRIRRTSMILAKRTEAATLFEKSPDPEMIMPALLMAIKLTKEYANAKVSSKIYDLYLKPYKPKTIKLPLQLVEQYLGIVLQSTKVINILNSLGFKSQVASHKLQVNVTVPSWRANDVAIPEDLIEEIARIYGYHRLPSVLMAGKLPTNYPQEFFSWEYKVKNILAGIGLTEIYTNSLISKEIALASFFPLNEHLKIKNALSEDWLYLRRSIVPSHLKAIKDNASQKTISFFEIAKVYQPQKNNLPLEKSRLTITTTKNYFYLKGVVELLFHKLYLDPVFKPKNILSSLWEKNKTTQIMVGDKVVGTLGDIKLSADFPYEQIQACEINLRALLSLGQLYPKFQPISGFPAVIEDLTFTVSPHILYDNLQRLIFAQSPLINKVELVNLYRQNLTFQITYQSDKNNLDNKEISIIRKKIVQKIKDRGWGELKGKVTD